MKQLKRGLAFLLVLVMVMGSMGTGVMAAPKAKTGKKAAVKTVAITKPDTKTLVMKKGQSFALKTKVTTSGKKVSKAVSYKSSNEKIVKVTKKGKLKALKNGKATITVTSKADKKKKATIKVVVKTPVTKVKLNQKEISLTEGETAVVKATVSPKKATIKKVSYKSSNKAVAKVNSKGKITAVAEGTAVITVTSKDGNAKKATCKVTVKKAGQTSGETPTAAPSQAPTAAPSDKPAPAPSDKPVIAPGETKVPSATKAPETAGTKIASKKGDTYKVTDTSGKIPEVELTKSAAKKKAKTVVIPKTVKVDGVNYKVTAIAEKAFAGNKKLKTVVIGADIEKIGAKAFYKCVNLKKVTIQTTKLTAKTVGVKAFAKIHKKAVVKVPKAKKKAYKKWLKKRGIGGKQKIVTNV